MIARSVPEIHCTQIFVTEEWTEDEEFGILVSECEQLKQTNLSMFGSP